MPEEHTGDESVGSVADEAGRLFAALGDWARDQGPGLGAGVAAAAGTAAEAVRQVGEHVGVDESTCTWCPVCRTLHVVRSASPEVRAQLGVAATALLQAGAGLLAGFTADQGRTGAGEGPQGPVERIELDEDLPDGERRSGDDNGWEA